MKLQVIVDLQYARDNIPLELIQTHQFFVLLMVHTNFNAENHDILGFRYSYVGFHFSTKIYFYQRFLYIENCNISLHVECLFAHIVEPTTRQRVLAAKLALTKFTGPLPLRLIDIIVWIESTNILKIQSKNCIHSNCSINILQEIIYTP